MYDCLAFEDSSRSIVIFGVIVSWSNKESAMSNPDDNNEEREERRDRDDRRSLHRSVSFPYKTKQGLVILKDRRKAPDRRVNNITVEDAEIDEEEFIKKYQKFV